MDIQKVAEQKTGWYFSVPALVAGFFIVGPFVLPLVWCNPRFSKKMKIAVSVAIIVATVGVVAIFAKSLQSIGELYRLVQM